MPKPPTRMTWRAPGGEIVLDEDGCHFFPSGRAMEQPEVVAMIRLYDSIRLHATAGGTFGKPVIPTREELDTVSDHYRRAQAIMQQAIDDEIRG